MRITPKAAGWTSLAAVIAIAFAVGIGVATSHAQSDPKDITGLTANNSKAGTLRVSWNSVPNTRDYRISWTKQGEDYPSLTDTSRNAYPVWSTHTITGLEDDTTYKIRVRSRFNGSTPGNWSDDLIATTAGNQSSEGNSTPEPGSTPEPTPKPEPTAQPTPTPEPTQAPTAFGAPANLRHGSVYFVEWESVTDAEDYEIEAYVDQWISLTNGGTTSGISLTLAGTIAVVTAGDDPITKFRVRAVSGSSTRSAWSVLDW